MHYDLLRTGSVERTTEKILERGFLDAVRHFRPSLLICLALHSYHISLPFHRVQPLYFTPFHSHHQPTSRSTPANPPQQLPKPVPAPHQPAHPPPPHPPPANPKPSSRDSSSNNVPQNWRNRTKRGRWRWNSRRREGRPHGRTRLRRGRGV